MVTAPSEDTGVSHYYILFNATHFWSTQQKHYMLRKSNCNRMQLHIPIVWPVLSEDVTKHVWNATFQNQRHMVTASHQLNILVSVITIHCSVHTHIMQHMMRKSNCNRMQLLILILWPVLSEDAIKHPMVGKSQEHEHNCYMHQLWSTRKYCRITPSFIPRSSQSLSLTLCKSIGKAWDVPTT